MLKTFDTKEAIPESQRATAIETKDNKWIVEEVDDGLGEKGKVALQAERERADAAEKARRAAEKKAADLERAAEARAKGITEEQLAELQRKEAEARKPLEDDLAKTKAENRKLKLTDRVKAMALTKGVMPDRIAKAMKDLDGRLDLTADGNSIVVLDEAGKPTAENWETFIGETYKKEAPFFFKGVDSSGSGTGTSEGGGNGDGTAAAIAAGKAAAAKQKAGAAENSLAFK